MTYQPTIGLEIHVQLKTRTKMFCACPNEFEPTGPNTNVCPICFGHPGTLPVPNSNAIQKVLLVGLAFNGKVQEFSQFDRKNYFYPDLPKGYQISQYKYPFVLGGQLEILNHKTQIPNKSQNTNSKTDITLKEIRIRRVHLEEDTGRLAHPDSKNYSLVDLNRAGVPLMELVTEPDIASGREARAFCEELQLILRYLDVSNADMEKGQMRCEVNISVAAKGKKGTKVEIKNLNSFKAVEQSIDYEIMRQTADLQSHKKIVHETRGWNEARERTESQRGKEQAHDYRYFPEPDIPPFKTSPDEIETLKKSLPELPAGKRARFGQEYGLGASDIAILITNRALGNLYEHVASELTAWTSVTHPSARKLNFLALAKLAANYLITHVARSIEESGKTIRELNISAENVAELIKMVAQNEVSSTSAQAILREVVIARGEPHHIADERGLLQVSDERLIQNLVLDIINSNPKPVADYKTGNQNALQFLVGQVMKASKGRANPTLTRELLLKHLTPNRTAEGSSGSG